MPSLVTFNNKIDKEFSRAVKKRVNAYFEEKGISKHANPAMVIKTIAILSLYWVPFALILTAGFSVEVMWLLCLIMGIGMAGIGFSVTHDALHGAYSSNPTVNNILGTMFDLVGANGYIWKITHNIIHHTYTNIHGHDEDLEVAEFIRLSPIQNINLYIVSSMYWLFRLIVLLPFFGYL